MAVSIPIEFCDYLLGRSEGVAEPLFINLKLNRNKAKKDNKLDHLELEKETIPRTTYNAVQCPGKKGFYEDDKCSGLGIFLRGENEIDIGLWRANCLIKANTSATSHIGFFKSPIFTQYYNKEEKLAKEDIIFNNEVKSNGPITRAVESLYWAAEDNDLEGVREILTHTLDSSCRFLINERQSLRFDVNLSDPYGITPLHVASANQNVEVVDFLLSYGADPNALTINGMSPITICTFAYLEKYSVGHNKGPHLVELGVGQRPSDVWSRAELVWLFGCDGSDPLASYNEDGALIIRSSDDEGYIETDVSRFPKTVLHTRELVRHDPKPSRFDKYMSCNQYLEALRWDTAKKPTPRGSVGCKSKRPRVTSTSTEATQVTQADLRGMRRSIRYRARLKTMLLLLQHGADPNTVTQPLPPLIAAARAGDVELSQLLLLFGADPNIRVPRELTMTSKTEFTDNHGNVNEPSTGGLTALHFAVVLPGEVGVKLTQTLLQGGANPTLRALPDASFLVDIEIVQLLVDHGADLNLLCNGQSALSLALTCGNDEVREPDHLVRPIASLLLTYPQTKAEMGLTHGLGSSLCVVLHPVFEHVRSFDSRLTLLSKLISHCPSGLLNHRVIMPYEMVEGNIVDYIHHAYTQFETKLLGDPTKCQVLKNRHHTLKCLAAELRKTVFASEMWKRIQARQNAEKVAVKARSGFKKQSGNQLPVPPTRNGQPAHCYSFYMDRIYMTKDAIEHLLEENFSSPGNYSFL
ncbi:Ankyrin repeat and MYND domain-containing protein 1 [Taenia solium]|eukprot:TsM_001086600 transcript=TsM_001086600 gene=TsM_001086600